MGSCWRMLPDPNPPMVISTEPRNPSIAGRDSAAVANVNIRKKCWATDAFEASSWVRVGFVISSRGPVSGHAGQLGQPRLGSCIDGGGRQRGQRPLAERGMTLVCCGRPTYRLDAVAQFAHLRVAQRSTDRGPQQVGRQRI